LPYASVGCIRCVLITTDSIEHCAWTLQVDAYTRRVALDEQSTQEADLLQQWCAAQYGSQDAAAVSAADSRQQQYEQQYERQYERDYQQQQQEQQQQQQLSPPHKQQQQQQQHRRQSSDTNEEQFEQLQYLIQEMVFDESTVAVAAGAGTAAVGAEATAAGATDAATASSQQRQQQQRQHSFFVSNTGGDGSADDTEHTGEYRRAASYPDLLKHEVPATDQPAHGELIRDLLYISILRTLRCW
jgi:nitrate reductase alpha subunit